MTDTGMAPQTTKFMEQAAKAQIAEFEEIHEVNKVAAPKTAYPIVQVKDVKVGDEIYLHTLGAGPYKVEEIHIPKHPALKGSLVVLVASWFNGKEWVDPDVLNFQFTQRHHEVELRKAASDV